MAALPCVLILGCPRSIVEAVGIAAERASVRAYVVDAKAARVEAERKKPLVLVVWEELYEREALVLDAIAMDVRSTIVCIEDGTFDQLELDMLVAAAIARTHERRGKSSPVGGYAIVTERTQKPKKKSGVSQSFPVEGVTGSKKKMKGSAS